ncbi:MAG TPA: protein kinase [Gammaproteobacteria bacterium]|nr:protein kinase [Gammaproteobacteria bacterium]
MQIKKIHVNKKPKYVIQTGGQWYIQQKTLGQGSYGTVYRMVACDPDGTNLNQDQAIALKVSKVRYPNDSINEFEAAKEENTLLVKNRQDKNPVNEVDSKDGKNIFSAMPIMGEAELADYLTKKFSVHKSQNRLMDVYGWMAGLGEQLVDLHNRLSSDDRAKLHMDIKPDNILLDSSDMGAKKANLIDFGLAATYDVDPKVLEKKIGTAEKVLTKAKKALKDAEDKIQEGSPKSHLARLKKDVIGAEKRLKQLESINRFGNDREIISSTVAGTVPYMAPEVLRGRRSNKSDIYIGYCIW